MKAAASTFSLLMLALLAAPGATHAQSSQPATAPYIETFDVRLHDVDVIVTDRSGKPVSGLRKDDFEVLENGAAQALTNFTVYGDSSGRTSSGDAVTAADAEPASPRRFVFFIDELALHPYTRRKLIVHATKLIRSSMQPGDEAMIITPAAEEKVALPFTGNVETVIAALEAVFKATGSQRTMTQRHREEQFLERQLAAAPRLDTLHGDTSIEHQRRQVKRMYARAANRRVAQRLGQLRSIVAALGEVPGRKVLVLATDSLSATPGLEAFRADGDRSDLPEVNDVQNDGVLDSAKAGTATDMAKSDGSTDADAANNPNWSDQRGAIREIARKASTNGITIYGMQPEFGLPLAAPGGVETRRGHRAGVLNTTFLSETVAGTETTLAMLSDLTGGKWYRGDGPVDDAFRQVASDVSTYYSLGYPAPEGKSDIARTIAVRVKGRPELTVRFRKELVEKSLQQEMTDQVVASLLVPRSRNELDIAVTANAAPMDGLTRLVTVDVNVPMDKLLFLPEGNDTYKAQFSVHYAAAGQTADFMAGENRNQYIAISSAEYARIAGKQWKYSARLRVPAGQLNIAVGVMDVTSRLTGFRTVRVAGVQQARQQQSRR